MREISNSKHSGVSEAAVREALAPYGLFLTPQQVEMVQLYLSLLVLWNQEINLTSVVEPRRIFERHFGESMFAARMVPIKAGRLADVGSGAGFPGLPIKIACGDLQVILIEANTKKTAFLAEVKRRLRLEGVEILRSRLEELPTQPGSLDFVVARAVGGFDRLLEWSSVSLVKGGRLVLWLGAHDAGKISQRPDWTWREPIAIPNSLRRVLLVGEST